MGKRKKGVQNYLTEWGEQWVDTEPISGDSETRRGGAVVGGNDGSRGIPRGPCAGPSQSPAVLQRVT